MSDLKIVKTVPWSELERQVREITLFTERDGKKVYPYRDAAITLETVTYAETRPTTLYVVRNNLETQAHIESCLADRALDPLSLPGGVVLQDSSTNGDTVQLTPPFVEVTESDGAYVLDGTHRTYRAHRAGRLFFTAIVVRDIPKEYPAYALPNDWSEIIEYDETPSNPALKKRYIDGDYRSLYRDFGPINGSSMRS
jgi:hypothetical protein